MQICTFSRTGATHVGVLDPAAGTVVSLGLASGGDPRFASLLALVRSGAAGLAEAGELAESHPASAVHDVDAVTLRAPLPDPPRVHGTAGTAVTRGPGDVVTPAPGIALAAVVDATAGLFGATILAGAQGPVVVTADELAAATRAPLGVEVRVNGTVRSRTVLPDALAALERAVTAIAHRQPGELVVLDLPVAVDRSAAPLRDGDEVETEVAGLGLLRNRIQL